MSDSTSLVREAYRLSEQRLEWQFNSALAADQRAVSASAMLIGAAAILAALAERAPAPIIVLIGALGLAISAFLSWHSARPTDFYAPGAAFDDLKEDIEETRNIDDVLSELGRYRDKHAEINDQKMRGCARLMKWAFGVAIGSVSLTILGQTISILYR